MTNLSWLVRKGLALALVLVPLTSCTTMHRLDGLRIGMTEEQVIAQMGPPERKVEIATSSGPTLHLWDYSMRTTNFWLWPITWAKAIKLGLQSRRLVIWGEPEDVRIYASSRIAAPSR